MNAAVKPNEVKTEKLSYYSAAQMLSDNDFSKYYLEQMLEYNLYEFRRNSQSSFRNCSNCKSVITRPEDLRRYYGMSLHPECFRKVYYPDEMDRHVKKSDIFIWRRVLELKFGYNEEMTSKYRSLFSKILSKTDSYDKRFPISGSLRYKEGDYSYSRNVFVISFSGKNISMVNSVMRHGNDIFIDEVYYNQIRKDPKDQPYIKNIDLRDVESFEEIHNPLTLDTIIF